MKPELGEIVEFICDYKKTSEHGVVIDIIKEVPNLRPRLVLVQYQGVKGPKQWLRPSRILSIISEGWSYHKGTKIPLS
jgi:hypothetical protein